MGWLAEKRMDLLEQSVKGLRWLALRAGAVGQGPTHLETGIEGENAAFFYLRRKGYVVVARRWSSGLQRGDLDLIAWQGELLCFVEVKTRTAHDVAAAEVTVDADKRRTLRRLARQYVGQLPMRETPPARFDVLSVYLLPGRKREFVHFEGAFSWSERGEYELR